MTRFFYKDRDKARWMSKRFGMRFVNADGRRVKWKGLKLMARGQEYKGVPYIHIDDEQFLEPRIADLVEHAPGDESYYGLIMICPVQYCRLHKVVRIVERDGIAFMKPECEESRRTILTPSLRR